MLRRSQGQGSTETMLIISVVVLTLMTASATLIPLFKSGVEDLGGDVQAILSTGSVGGVGGGGTGGTNNSNSPMGANTGNGGLGNGGVNRTVNSSTALRAAGNRGDFENTVRGMSNAGTQGGDPTDIGSPLF